MSLLKKASAAAAGILCIPSALAALTDTPVDWSNFSYISYTYGGVLISDFESSSDPSNGGAAVSPDTIDVASCSLDGAAQGSVASTRIAYYDVDGNSATLGDAYLAFGIRLDANPLNSGQARGYTNNHWNVLIDIDNDGFKEFVLDLDGSDTGSQADRFFLRYNDLDTQEVDPGADTLEDWYAAGPDATGTPSSNNHTRVEVSSCGTEDDYWLDLQVPLTAFNVSGSQLISPGTPIRLFYSTSASNTNPLQKDWMMDPGGLGGGAFVLSDPIIFGDIYSGTGGVTALPEADLGISKAVDQTSPTIGDQVVFTLTVTNAGPDDTTAVVTDALPTGYTYVSDDGGGAYDSGTGTWTVGTVTAAGSTTLNILAAVNASGDYLNAASVFSADSTDPAPGNDTASASTSPVPANTAPIANDDLGTTDPDTPVTLDVLDNDVDPDGDEVTLTSVTDPPNGTAIIDTNGTATPGDDTIIYTPDAGFNSGTDSFSYDVEDGNGGTATAQVDVTVPVAIADVELEIAVDNTTPGVGDDVTFSITVNNEGPADAVAQVTFELGDGFDYVGDDSGGDYEPVSGIWNTGPIPPGGSVTLNVTATINSGGDYSVNAQISGLNADDPDTSPNPTGIAVSVQSAPTANTPVPHSIPAGNPLTLLLMILLLTVAAHRAAKRDAPP